MILNNKKSLYFVVALPAKFIKASFELIVYLFLSPSEYAKFIPIYNQSQIASTWILAGFGSAAYQYFSDQAYMMRLYISFTISLLNFFLIYFIINGFSLHTLFNLSFISIIAGLGWALINIVSVFLRVSNRLIHSVLVLEVIPFTSLIGIFIINNNIFLLSTANLFLGVIIISTIINVTLILYKEQGLIPKGAIIGNKIYSNIKQYYKQSTPFLVISCINVLLSRIDTTLIVSIVEQDIFAIYTTSVRLASLILTIGYIFQHYYFARITNFLKSGNIKDTNLTIQSYMRDTFIASGFLIALLYLCLKLGLATWIGLTINLSIFLLASLFYLLIAPLSIFTYVLVLNGKIKLVTMASLMGFGAFLVMINYFNENLDVIKLPIILLGSILFTKLLEAIYYLKINRALYIH